MTSAVTRLSCFSSIVHDRMVQLRARLNQGTIRFRPGKGLKVLSSDVHGTQLSGLRNEITPSCIVDSSRSHNGSSLTTFGEGSVVGASNGHVPENVISQTKRAAKIHDFCLGIPFGGIVLAGGLVSLIFSRNPAASSTGMLYGGALLALSTLSLNVWRQGKSSLPFIIGQAVLAFALIWKNFQAYSSTSKIFPMGLNAAISAAMLCFYCYVVISGGNPPPKKQKSSASIASS